MDFELSEDQVALSEGIRDLCQGRFDIDTVRGLADCGGVDRRRWDELTETGVFSLVVPEADGGVGLGWADAVLVYEQLGRALVPGPLVGTLLAAGVTDDAVVGLIERTEGPALVEYPDVIDALLVVDGDGVWRVDAADLGGQAVQSVDPLTPLARMAGLPRGDRVADAGGWADRAVLLSSALQVGVAQGARELAVAYAGERRQFGKPIGQFQAIKHLCADMFSREEVARAALYFAGCVLDSPELGDVGRAVSGARILAAEAADHNGKDCVQIHGGMGFTWEIDAHLYLKRAWALTPSFGSLDEHAERIAALV
ncbi:acyl-CoA dehydrogenase family protein [Candidatus Poriferisocius sp.]|uniref:acyl-CoA dehydrogenase family protein n=1 Tax=Candidatus Poriferisocius sp. TaxID=3101276 RepID=UPI003B5BB345